MDAAVSICTNSSLLSDITSYLDGNVNDDVDGLSVFGIEGNDGKIIELVTNFWVADITSSIHDMVDEYGVVSFATIASRFALPLDFVDRCFTVAIRSVGQLGDKDVKYPSDHHKPNICFHVENALVHRRLLVCNQLLEVCFEHLQSTLMDVSEPTSLTVSLLDRPLSACNDLSEESNAAALTSYFHAYVPEAVSRMCREGMLNGSVRGGGVQ